MFSRKTRLAAAIAAACSFHPALAAEQEQLKVGASLNWQDDIHNGIAEQDVYALVNLMASYDVDPNWSVSANLNNLTDEKYLSSLYWTQAYYGAPRNASLSVSWKY